MTLQEKITLAVFAGFVLGAAFAWYEIPTVSVTVVPPSVAAPGPDWMQPADEQAIAILAGNASRAPVYGSDPAFKRLEGAPVAQNRGPLGSRGR